MNNKLAPLLLVLAGMCIIILFAFPAISEPITVDARPAKLFLFNNTADTLYYALFEKRALSYSRWEPCSHPSLCNDPGIMPGMARRVPYEEIYHWYPGAEVTVLWWRLQPDSTAGDGYRLDGPYEINAATPDKLMLGM